MVSPVKLHITAAQVAKIRRGMPIQIPHKSMGHPEGRVFKNLHPETHKKLAKAFAAKKGARVQLTAAEMEGTGLMDVIKKVGKFFSKHSSVLKPLATAALDTGAHFVPAAASARELVRDVTGVGLKKRAAPKRRAAAKKRAPKCAPAMIGSGLVPAMAGSGLIPAGYSGF